MNLTFMLTVGRLDNSSMGSDYIVDNSNTMNYTAVMGKSNKEKTSPSVPIHTTSNGGRFIKPSDLLKNKRVQETLKKMENITSNTPSEQNESTDKTK